MVGLLEMDPLGRAILFPPPVSAAGKKKKKKKKRSPLSACVVHAWVKWRMVGIHALRAPQFLPGLRPAHLTSSLSILFVF